MKLIFFRQFERKSLTILESSFSVWYSWTQKISWTNSRFNSPVPFFLLDPLLEVFRLGGDARTVLLLLDLRTLFKWNGERILLFQFLCDCDCAIISTIGVHICTSTGPRSLWNGYPGTPPRLLTQRLIIKVCRYTYC